MKYLPEVEALFDECRVTKVRSRSTENLFQVFLQEFWDFCKVQVVHANEYRVSDKASEDILYPNTAHLQVHQMRNIQMFCKCTISNTTWVSGLGHTSSDLKNMHFLQILKFKVQSWQIANVTANINGCEFRLHTIAPLFCIFFKTWKQELTNFPEKKELCEVWLDIIQACCRLSFTMPSASEFQMTRSTGRSVSYFQFSSLFSCF